MIKAPLVAILRKLHHRVLSATGPRGETRPREEEAIRTLNDLLHGTDYPINPAIRNLASDYLDALANLLLLRLSDRPGAEKHEVRVRNRAERLLLDLEVAATASPERVPATPLLDFTEDCLSQAAAEGLPKSMTTQEATPPPEPGPSHTRLSDILMIAYIFGDIEEWQQEQERNLRLVDETLVASGRKRRQDPAFQHALDLVEHIIGCALGRIPEEEDRGTKAIARVRKRFDDRWGLDRIPAFWTGDETRLTDETARYLLDIGETAGDPPREPKELTPQEKRLYPYAEKTGIFLPVDYSGLELSTILALLCDFGKQSPGSDTGRAGARAIEEALLIPGAANVENRELQAILPHVQRLVDAILGRTLPLTPEAFDKTRAAIEQLEGAPGLRDIPLFKSPASQIIEEPAIDYLRKVATSKAALEREG